MEERRDRVKTALSDLDMRTASSVNEALTILRDEKRTPIAGATDVYVGLNFGTFKPRQFLDIWALDELRTISIHVIRNEIAAQLIALIHSNPQRTGRRFPRHPDRISQS